MIRDKVDRKDNEQDPDKQILGKNGDDGTIFSESEFKVISFQSLTIEKN